MMHIHVCMNNNILYIFGNVLNAQLKKNVITNNTGKVKIASMKRLCLQSFDSHIWRLDNYDNWTRA